jgi:hypothetical protein
MGCSEVVVVVVVVRGGGLHAWRKTGVSVVTSRKRRPKRNAT